MFRLFRIFSIRGTPVSIHGAIAFYMFFPLLFLATGEGSQEFLDTLLLLPACLFCLFLHELGHAISAWLLGIPVHSISIYPIIAVANIGPAKLTPSQELRIAMAGPLMNLVLGLIVWWLIDLFPSQESFLAYLRFFNIGLAVLNLIPGFLFGWVIDGGRILRSFLAMKYDSLRAGYISAQVAQYFAVALMILAIFKWHSFLLFGFAALLFVGALVEKFNVRLGRPFALFKDQLKEAGFDFQSMQSDSRSPPEPSAQTVEETGDEEDSPSDPEDDRIIEMGPDGKVRRVFRRE